MPLRFSTDIPERFQRHLRHCLETPDMAADLAGKALERFRTYESQGLQELFVTTQLPSGSVLVAGAGPSSFNLIKAIEHRAPGLQVAALVDRRAADIREVDGYEVLTAHDAAARTFDYAIVCNAVYEQSMVEDLRRAGVPEAKILAVHSMPAFREFHDRFVHDVVEARLLSKIRARVARVENVILVPSRDIWSVVDERALAGALAPETTIRLFFGPSAQLEVSDQYPTFDVGQSLPLVLSLLRRLAPRCVYVRGSAHFQAQHVAVAVRRELPETFLAFEVYDYMSMFDEEILNGWAFDPVSVADNCHAEALMGLQADFILDKTPGPGWKALTATAMTAPRQAYFPCLAGAAPPPLEPERPGLIRLLCAGTIPEFRRYRPGVGFRDSVFQDIIRPIEQLAEMDDCVIDIYNSGHVPGSPGSERDYAGYRTYFPPRRVSYNPGLPFAQLLAGMGGYDFGILLFSATDMVVDFPLQESLPNRFMGYVSGGLPIIINKEVRYAASLVDQFQAGITIGAEDLADLPRRIREADPGRMRAGVTALRDYLLLRNDQAIKAFREALAANLEGCPQ